MIICTASDLIITNHLLLDTRTSAFFAQCPVLSFARSVMTEMRIPIFVCVVYTYVYRNMHNACLHTNSHATFTLCAVNYLTSGHFLESLFHLYESTKWIFKLYIAFVLKDVKLGLLPYEVHLLWECVKTIVKENMCTEGRETESGRKLGIRTLQNRSPNTGWSYKTNVDLVGTLRLAHVFLYSVCVRRCELTNK